ncbi:MAG TPA: hypothetical protein VHB25_07700 [Gemmatimonadaceae bacterium]|nr:hypothetical protein [Gemmatimonadaceae bacterium]
MNDPFSGFEAERVERRMIEPDHVPTALDPGDRERAVCSGNRGELPRSVA